MKQLSIYIQNTKGRMKRTSTNRKILFFCMTLDENRFTYISRNLQILFWAGNKVWNKNKLISSPATTAQLCWCLLCDIVNKLERGISVTGEPKKKTRESNIFQHPLGKFVSYWLRRRDTWWWIVPGATHV